MERDYNRDRIKGLACLMMLIAHIRLAPPVSEWADTVVFVCSFGAMLFLAISGLNAASAAKRKSLAELAITNALLFLIGITYGAIVQQQFYNVLVFEILQIIAIGSFCVGVTAKYLSDKPAVFGVISVVICTAHLLLQAYLPLFDGFGLIETSNRYVPFGTELPEGGIRYPGFALLPWLAAFFWGAAIYSASKLIHLSIIVIGIALCAINNPITPLIGDIHEKWDMSLGYIVLSAVSYSAVILLFRSIPKALLEKDKLLNYIGLNSFPFLYLHLFAIPLWFLGKSIGHAGLWVVAMGLVLTLMLLYSRWEKSKRSYPLVFWAVLMLIALTLPVLPTINIQWHLPLAFVFAFIGLFFVKYFNEIKQLLIKALVKG